MSCFFAARLAWRQLVHEKAKLFAAMLGVLFACVLVFMQLGFRDALYASIVKVPTAMEGDLFLVHKQTEAIWRTVPFPLSQVKRAFGNDQVESATPLYIGLAPWKNPETRVKRTLMIFGYDPYAQLFRGEDIRSYANGLVRDDKIIFDSLSRPEFGPVDAHLAKGQLFTEVNDRKMEVLGTFHMGASFAADGNAITSDQNFQRIFTSRNVGIVDVGVIRLKPGADVAAVQADLASKLDEYMSVLTHQGLTDYEMAYWQNNAPIGFIFGFGVIMGLVVGMVIVYQILFTDITNHLGEYATLKAMGYSHQYLMYVVFSASVILAVAGFVPGLLLSAGLYHMAEGVLFMPMPLGPAKIASVFSMMLGMCTISGFIAMRKLRAANPADMF